MFPGRVRALLLILVLTMLGVPVAAPPAAAAALQGYDVSWPQCPPSVGGYGLPLPPSSAQFVIIGLTRGLPFTENPCLQSQVDWARQNGTPAQAYTIAAFPTAAQLASHAAQGPWSPGTRAGQLSNVGYAEARFAVESLARVGFAPPVVWIDVEPRAAQPWPTATRAQVLENRYVLEGLMRGLRDAGLPYGLYSYQGGWETITHTWRLPGVPVWATAGRLDYPTEAQDRCVQPSFSGGPVHLAQWYDDTRDYDITCGSYAFTPLAMPPSSAASVSDFDGDWNADVLARAAGTGALWLYPGDGRSGWLPWRQVGAGWGVFDALDTPGDWNGDGTVDVLARGRATGDLWLYPGDGRGGWRPESRIGVGWTGMSAIVSPGDFTGDERADVLAREASSGVLWLYPGDGRGGWLPRVRVGTGWNAMDAIVAAGDANLDGTADVLAREAGTGTLWLYPGNGRSGWLPRAQVGVGWDVMSAIVGVGDFTGDRTVDVLAREAGTGTLWLYPRGAAGEWLARTQVGWGWNTFDAMF